MNFLSFAFALLFATCCVARFTLGRDSRNRGYQAVLLIASAVFYAWHVPAFLSIILASGVIDFYAGRGIADAPPGAPRRKSLLVLSLTANLGLLAFFKYANFGLDLASDLLAMFGQERLLPVLSVTLPMGISFYTFQSMSYTIDVYRGCLQPERRPWRFFLYIAFFPQLVAGPIVRATDFLYQLRRRRTPSLLVFSEGLFLIIRGFFLKSVCADQISIYVDRFWGLAADPSEPANLWFNLTLAFLFSTQIFCDFAGYSSIARGVAYLLGFRLPINFNAPYIANSFSEFWRRWHITLSQWLRDYLYIPLGGNRGSEFRTYRNLMFVMLFGGLWHGAAMTFVAWGAVHGGVLAIERLFRLERARRSGFVTALAYFVVVQATVLVTWVLFRSRTLPEAMDFLANTVTGDVAFRFHNVYRALVFTLPMIVLHGRRLLVERGRVPEVGPIEKAALAACMLLGLITFYGETGAFIYFQF